MSERWGDSARDRAELDRWLTTEPEDEEAPLSLADRVRDMSALAQNTADRNLADGGCEDPVDALQIIAAELYAVAEKMDEITCIYCDAQPAREGYLTCKGCAPVGTDA